MRRLKTLFLILTLMIPGITSATDYTLNTDTLTGEMAEAMHFLYKYLPLPDKSGYSPDFFLENVRSSLKAREEMPWGKKIPDNIWKHFVLPIRVNNENLDLSRSLFYEELKERVKGLSMKEAILEVNHWCHEKATYRPSDARTSSPLSTVSQAIGRCGEESTFTVAALRSVGIPARQIYTPRWAHTDDNHAWVEAWADGEWYFLGACEPAPRLDIAWFNAPAARGLLMNTNVFGEYQGPEEILASNPYITTINATSKYAPTGSLLVKVVDSAGKPVPGATINFCIYNYAEFYPAVTRRGDSEGRARLTAGLGDMVIWATDGNRFGFSKGRPGDEEITIILDKDSQWNGSFEMDVIPPAQSGTLPVVTPDEEALNSRRLLLEDSIRHAYTAGFFSAESVSLPAAELGISQDQLARILPEARGNGDMIVGFLRDIEPSLRPRALALLSSISEKDRRDVTLPVLSDNLYNTPSGNISSPLFNKYILSPRIENEGLVPFKAFFQAELNPDSVEIYRRNPAMLAEMVSRKINIDQESNPRSLRMDPRAVWREGKSDIISRNIMFVAIARSIGIPARIDPVTSKTQYADSSEQWIDVDFNGNIQVASPQGMAKISYTPSRRIDNPRYYSQFSISRITDGIPVQLEYDEEAGLKEIAPDGNIKLDEGQYLLTTGQRMADGSVLVKGVIFNIRKDEATDVPLEIRSREEALQVLGNLKSDAFYYDIKKGKEQKYDASGYYVLAFIAPGEEPSIHLLNDMAAAKEALEETGEPIVILFKSMDDYNRFDQNAYPGLPSNVTFAVDTDSRILSDLSDSLRLETSALPVTAIADRFNRIVFLSQGYSIGLGNRLAEAFRSLK